MQLSGVPLSFSRPSLSGSVRSRPPTPLVPDSEALMMHHVDTPAFIFPPPSESVRSLPLEQPRERTGTPSSSSIYLAESASTLDARPSHPTPQSNLNILMAQHSRSPTRERADEEEDDTHQFCHILPFYISHRESYNTNKNNNYAISIRHPSVR